MKVLNEIEFCQLDKLNEYQLSILYLYACIWYRYDKSYSEFVKQRKTDYPLFRLIYSHASNYKLAFMDTFRPGYRSFTSAILKFA